MATDGCGAGRALGRRRGRAGPRPASPEGVSELDGLAWRCMLAAPRRARRSDGTPAQLCSGAGDTQIGGETSRTGRGLTGDSILQVGGRGGGPEEGHRERPELVSPPIRVSPETETHGQHYQSTGSILADSAREELDEGLGKTEGGVMRKMLAEGIEGGGAGDVWN